MCEPGFCKACSKAITNKVWLLPKRRLALKTTFLYLLFLNTSYSFFWPLSNFQCKTPRFHNSAIALALSVLFFCLAFCSGVILCYFQGLFFNHVDKFGI